MRVARRVAIAITGLFLVLLPLQFLFAGYGVFSGEYETHEGFGAGLLHLLTLLALLGFLASRQWRAAGFTFVVFAVFSIQIGFVSIGRDNDAPWVSALHPFLAFCYWPWMYFLVWRPQRDALHGAMSSETVDA